MNKTCLIINSGHTHDMIQQDKRYFDEFSKLWGKEFSSYFNKRMDDSIVLPNLTVCKYIGIAEGYYCFVRNDKDYAIISRK